MAPLELAGAALTYRSSGFQTTSDFSQVLASVAQPAAACRVRSRTPPTYRLWARRAPNAPDFRAMTPVAMSGAPDLLRTNEHGEFKVGTMADSGETYSIATYGRIVGISRHAIVNDDLRAFDRAITGFAGSAARLENRIVYAQLTANAAMCDGNPLFSAAHANFATGGSSALQFASLATMRARRCACRRGCPARR